ncbi:pyruvate, phosphate dikinase [Azospirillum picis]|uniref:Pyruvate,orthophosphate dikinase n=1 Tax=Azospirillum picis TaxID=488438 RepID=A0ABU0MHR5_9PROT|nr:pyruvate, phosphate dikinase [Azospirillum picis]MBP2298834.1 pyruvate,orthophosphate dikinase [Azospirillum picis]MDQ0532924.1 pyruvate,orthophosphate dikinase [Azospirillum picis]
MAPDSIPYAPLPPDGLTAKTVPVGPVAALAGAVTGAAVGAVSGAVAIDPAADELVVAFGPGLRAAADPERLGNKGARLVEMAALGIPVPPGFVIAAEAGRRLDAGQALPEALQRRIGAAVADLEARIGARFGDPGDPLLLSVRSGAAVSMPGMMDSILNLGLNDRTVEGLAARSGDERFAWDCYRRLVQCFGCVVMGVPGHRFEALLDEHKDGHGILRDAEMGADDWRALLPRYFRLIETRCGRPFPQEPAEQLRAAVAAVFGSWMNPRAAAYRSLHDIPDDLGTAVTVQAMVFGNRGPDSGTGVLFTRDPSTGAPGLCGEFLADAQGEDVVSGTCDPDPLSAAEGEDAATGAGRSLEVRMPSVYAELRAVAGRLEREFGDMQDIEFTVDGGRLFILQSRSGKRSSEASVRIAVDLADEGVITRAQAVGRVDPQSLDELLRPAVAPDSSASALAIGLPASPGAVTGHAAFTTEDAVRMARGGTPVLLCRPETSPEDIRGMQAAVGVVTARGGFTSHAATVARGMGRPCVCGARTLRIDPERGEMTVGAVTVRTGDLLTIDGASGAVLLGAVPLRRPQPDGAVGRLLDWARACGGTAAAG